MLDKNRIIHDIVMLHLEKTYDFNDFINDESQLAIEYEMKFENVKNQLTTFTLIEDDVE